MTETNTNAKHDLIHQQLRERAVVLLGDGEWHPYPLICRQLMELVPPGVGIRRTERMRRNASPGARERVKQRSSADLARSGAMDVVREFLRNTRVFEVDKVFGPGARPMGSVDERKVRMIAMPQALTGSNGKTARYTRRRSLLETENERLQNEIEALKDKIAMFRTHLIGLGKEELANQIAPPAEVDEINAGRQPWR